MIVTTIGPKKKVFDVPESVLQQYEVAGEMAAQIFIESAKATGAEISKSASAMSATRMDNAESLSEVQA